MPPTLTVRPIQVFQQNIRPAELLLQVYKLLEGEEISTEKDMIDSLRLVVGAKPDEDLMLIYNHLFVGLVRESARMTRSDLKRTTLSNLLRQAVVAACTGLDSYLPALLRASLPTVLDMRGRQFVPQDKELRNYFQDFKFSLEETLRLLEAPEEGTTYIANKMLGWMSFRYLSSSKGVRVVGLLLVLNDPWALIAERLGRKNSNELEQVINDTAERRNDIVHRADRSARDPEGPIQEITLAFAEQAVDTIKHVCMALDELVKQRMIELRAQEQLAVS